MKLLAKEFSGYVPVTFLLKCQRLKDFGGASAEGTFKVMLDALRLYFPSDELVKNSLCSNLSGALTSIVDLAGWDLPSIHCMNHRLELVMKNVTRVKNHFRKLRKC